MYVVINNYIICFATKYSCFLGEISFIPTINTNFQAKNKWRSYKI